MSNIVRSYLINVCAHDLNGEASGFLVPNPESGETFQGMASRTLASSA